MRGVCVSFPVALRGFAPTRQSGRRSKAVGLLLMATVGSLASCTDEVGGNKVDASLSFLDRGAPRMDSRAAVVVDSRSLVADSRAARDRSVARDGTAFPVIGDAGCAGADGACARCTKNSECPDALKCTEDTCNAQGRCVHKSTCQSGRWCTSAGCVACDESHLCAGGGRCVAGFCWDATCAANRTCDDTVPCTDTCTVEGGTKVCRKLGAAAYAWVTEAQLACGSAAQPLGATYQCQGRTHRCCANGEWGDPDCSGCARTRLCTAATPCEETCSLDGVSKSCRKINDRPWEWITYDACGSAAYPLGTLFQCGGINGACCAVPTGWSYGPCPS